MTPRQREMRKFIKHDPVLRALDRCQAIDEVVFKLTEDGWKMGVSTSGPYQPKIELYNAFLRFVDVLQADHPIDTLNDVKYSRMEGGTPQRMCQYDSLYPTFTFGPIGRG